MRTLDPARVRERLAQVPGASLAELERALARYESEGHDGDEDAFFAWLEGEGLIDPPALATLIRSDDVTVTHHLPPRLSSTSAPTVITSAGGPASGTSSAGRPSGAPAARYVILSEAGRGGMGTVHVARDTELLRKVALKALSAEFSASSARVRFVREVQITAQLDHPHIVPVYSLEVAPSGTPAYAMKLVEGRTLSEYLEETCRAHESGAAPDEAHALPARLEHFLKICDAINYAHGKGVIHRDLKPSNVMLGRHNEIYVMDWGICRIQKEVADDVTTALAHHLSEDAGETREGSVLGTPAFMSPEQARAARASWAPRATSARSASCSTRWSRCASPTRARPLSRCSTRRRRVGWVPSSTPTSAGRFPASWPPSSGRRPRRRSKTATRACARWPTTCAASSAEEPCWPVPTTSGARPAAPWPGTVSSRWRASWACSCSASGASST